MNAIVKAYASELYDRITAILAGDEAATMANVALYMWFAKYATDQSIPSPICLKKQTHDPLNLARRRFYRLRTG